MKELGGNTILIDATVDIKDLKKLQDKDFWALTLMNIVTELGLTYINGIEEKFNIKDSKEDGGISATAILLESHISVHTWPEHSYFRLELSSCRKDISVDKLIANIQKKIECTISVATNEWQFNNKKIPFGWHISLDLKDCNDLIQSKESLRTYVSELCRLLEMKTYGKCLIEYFGEASDKTAGYSLFQFIETSAITGHFSNAYHTAYIDIFSCKPYDYAKVIKFTSDFFGTLLIDCKCNTRYL